MKKPHYHHTYDKELRESSGLDLRVLGRLASYIRPYRYFVLIAIAILIVAKAIEAYIPVYIGRVTQAILSPTAAEEPALLSQVVTQCLTIMGFLLFAFLLDSINVVLKNWVGQKSLYRLRLDVYRHIQQMPLEYFNTHAVGSLMTRTIHDVDQINLMFSESVVPLMGSLLLFLCILVGIFTVDVHVALVLLATLPVVFLLTNHFRIHQRQCYQKIRGIVSSMNGFVQEHLMGASTIRSFGLQEQEMHHFDQINEDNRNANVETIHHFAFFFAGIDFVQSLALILVFFVLVQFTPASISFQAGTYFTFSIYVLMLFRPLADLAERYNLLQSAIAAADRIFHVLDQNTEEFHPPKETTINKVQTIEFEDVWFAYSKENWVLKGLTFSIRHGESLAIVGVTGAGKTTLLNLLNRFYTVQKGTIKINGININDIPLPTLRRQFSIVLQDPEIFSGTLADNITLGNAAITPDKLQAVTAYVNLGPLIESSPEGIQRHLTERGKGLSAGERQLISMARAVAFDRSVLIFDEATANIDSKTESIIQEAMKKILRDKTTLVIAHRLSTIKDVDRIIVLDGGVVAETGTHNALLKAGGIYEKLYRLQLNHT